jgi:hypothetical protein
MTTDSLHQEAAARGRRAGISSDLMEAALRAQRQDRPYVVEYEDKPCMPFYRVTLEGPSRILYINTAHPFFTELYAAPGATRRFRDGLEVFLWCLGICELQAAAPDQATYVQERRLWSGDLAIALPILSRIWGGE